MKIPFPFFENSQGKPDGMFTLAVYSFALVVAVIIWSALSSRDLSLTVTHALTLYTGTITAYFGRKFTDKKHGSPAAALPPPAAPSARVVADEGPLPGEDLSG